MSGLFAQVWTVLRAEILMHFRDRRSLSSAMSLPIMGPVMFAGMLIAFAGWMNKDKVLEVPVVGAANAPGLIAHLERAGVVIEPAPEDPEQAVAEGDEALVLVIPEAYPTAFEKGEPAHLQLIHDGSKNASRTTVSRVERLLEGYAGQIASQRLILRGVSPSLMQAVVVDDVDLATPQKLAGQLMHMMVLFLIMGAFSAAIPGATDTLAGERERGSLEALLLNPVDRRALILGKWLGVCLIALLSALLMIVGYVIAIRFVPLQDLGVRGVFGGLEALQAVVVLLPLVLLATAAELVVSTFARSYKEAQTYLNLAILIPALPSFVLAFRPVEPQVWMGAIPATGQDLAISAILRGEGLNLAALSLSYLVCGLLTLVCLAVCVRMISGTRIVFGGKG